MYDYHTQNSEKCVLAGSRNLRPRRALAGVADVALPLIAVGALGATGWQASAVTAAESAGLVLFGLFAGVVSDRHNRVSVITTANVLRAVAFLALPIGGSFK